MPRPISLIARWVLSTNERKTQTIISPSDAIPRACAEAKAGQKPQAIAYLLVATNAHQVLADPRLTAPVKAVAGAGAGLSPSAAANTDNATKPGATAIAQIQQPGRPSFKRARLSASSP